MMRLKVVLGCCLLFVPYLISANDVFSPKDYGLADAKTGIERYWVLYNTHVAAVNEEVSVSYAGIDTIRIEIPQNAPTIPLSENTDFAHAVIVVKNVAKHAVLFSLSNDHLNNVNYSLLEKRKRVMNEGNQILVIEDTIPWVKNRRGYNYGHIRKDIVHVCKGKVEGTVISSYSTRDSAPVFKVCSVNDRTKSIKNLTVLRDSACLYRTNVVSFDNQYNIVIDNITIKTPPNSLYGDAAIRLENCYKVKILNTVIQGTYSQKDQYGYGISLNNVSDVEIVGLKGDADWGIFGNNNVNNTRLRDCDINRFDVHCYGKDISFENCTFRNLYNQFSSMFGTVSFEHCTFYDFTPVLFESSYNAYTKFDLIFKDCVVYPSKQRCSLIHGGDLNGEKTDGRKELEQQEYPDLYIDGLQVIMPSEVDKFYIYNFKRRLIQWPKDEVPGIRKLKGLEIVPQKEYSVSNLSNMIVIPEGKRVPLMCVGGMTLALVLVLYCWIKRWTKDSVNRDEKQTENNRFARRSFPLISLL